MEAEWAHTHGWLQHEVTIAMTPDELAQLRFAASIALAHGIDQPILEQLLAATDNL